MVAGAPARACWYTGSIPERSGLSDQLCCLLEQVLSSKAPGETLKVPVGYSKCKVCRCGHREPQKERDV